MPFWCVLKIFEISVRKSFNFLFYNLNTVGVLAALMLYLYMTQIYADTE